MGSVMLATALVGKATVLVLYFVARAMTGSIAFVTVATDNGKVPSGTVEIREGTTVVKRLNVVLGIAIGTVPSGKHTYTATFVPNDAANVSPSTSAPVCTR